MIFTRINTPLGCDLLCLAQPGHDLAKQYIVNDSTAIIKAAADDDRHNSQKQGTGDHTIAFC